MSEAAATPAAPAAALGQQRGPWFVALTSVWDLLDLLVLQDRRGTEGYSGEGLGGVIWLVIGLVIGIVMASSHVRESGTCTPVTARRSR